jgi:hypothetical protein
MHSLSKRTGQRTLLVSITLSEVDGTHRACAMLDGVTFHLRGPQSRYLQAWINDSGRWTWDASGDPQSFENVEYCRARRIKDRLSVDIVDEYAAALGLRMFDAEFYAPDGRGVIVARVSKRQSKSIEVSLEQVQTRLERGWWSVSSYDEL